MVNTIGTFLRFEAGSNTKIMDKLVAETDLHFKCSQIRQWPDWVRILNPLYPRRQGPDMYMCESASHSDRCVHCVVRK